MINKIEKPLRQKKERKKAQITKISNEISNVTTDYRNRKDCKRLP